MSLNMSRAPFQVFEEGSRTTVCFDAGTTLSELNTEDVGRELAALTQNRERPHLFLDLGGVAMMTSVALAKFVALNRQAQAAGGRLTLFNLTPTVRQVFKLTRLDTVLEIHSSAQPIPA
jgi:anti-anti-sigma factor